MAGKDSMGWSPQSLDSSATCWEKFCKKSLTSVQPDSFRPCSERNRTSKDATSLCHADVFLLRRSASLLLLSSRQVFSSVNPELAFSSLETTSWSSASGLFDVLGAAKIGRWASTCWRQYLNDVYFRGQWLQWRTKEDSFSWRLKCLANLAKSVHLYKQKSQAKSSWKKTI